MKERVSVVIPMLNEEENILNCLDGLYNQVESPYEIIVVDNGSDDNGPKLVKNCIKKFRKKGIELNLIKCSYGNQSDARDMAMRKVKGTIIGSLDSDSIPSKNWIKVIRESFADKKIVGICGKTYYRNRGIVFNFFYFIGFFLMFRNVCVGCNSAIRKSSFDFVNGFNGLKELREKENLYYVKDDYFITKKLKRIGIIRFNYNLKATLLSRVRENSKVGRKGTPIQSIKRVKYEIIDSYKILRYFKKNEKDNFTFLR